MNNKRLGICIFGALAALLSSCIDEIEQVDITIKGTSEQIVFGGVRADDIIITRSGEAPAPEVTEKVLESESGTSLPLFVKVEQGINPAGPATRAAITTKIDEITQLDAWATKNTYADASKKQVTKRELFFFGSDGKAETGALFTKKAGNADIDSNGTIDGIFYPDGNGPYLWEKSASSVSDFNFVTVSPAGSGFKAVINPATLTVTFDYEVPAAAADQKDVLVAVPDPVPVNYGAPVPLDYKHVMAAVNVKVGGQIPAGVIKSIKFTGVYDKASYYPATNEWTNRSIKENGGEFSVTLPEGGFAVGPDGAGAGSAITTAETSFMMIPQQPESGAKIVVEFLPEGHTDPILLSASLQGDVWEMNTTTNYLINISPNWNITIDALDKILDSHYIMTKVEVSLNNIDYWRMEVTSQLVDNQGNRTNEPKDLVTVLAEEDVNPMVLNGYWTDKVLERDGAGYKETTVSARGDWDIDGTGTLDSKIFYVFIPENISGKTREISVKLYDVLNPSTEKTHTLTQHPVVWVDPYNTGIQDDYWGCELIIEGGQVPWGFSWNGLKEQYRLVQGSGNPWGQIKNTLLPAMQKAGIDYENFPEYIWMATEHADHKDEFVLIIDYEKIATALKVGLSETDGFKNTWELYSFDPDKSIESGITGFGLIAALKEVINSLGNVERVTEGDIGLINTTDNYAALKALQRNRFNVYVDEVNSIYLPILSEADANWFLPAKKQYDEVLSKTTWGQKFSWNDMYWTSTICHDPMNPNTDTGEAYMFTIGMTYPENRMNNHYAMAMRYWKHTVELAPDVEVIPGGSNNGEFGEGGGTDNNTGGGIGGGTGS